MGCTESKPTNAAAAPQKAAPAAQNTTAQQNVDAAAEPAVVASNPAVASPNNQEWQLVRRPNGLPVHEDFRLVEIAEPDEAELKEGEILLDLHALSVDPYMRPRMQGGSGSYIQPFALGEAMSGSTVGVVKASKAEQFPVGSYATGFALFRKRQIVSAEGMTPASDKVPLTYFLGTLGLTGVSAFLPIKHIAEPKAGETAFVSGAAGAVGMAAVQILKLKGCRVIGSAGSPEKVQEVLDMGADAAFDYKTTDDYAAKLKEVAPEGIDIYFDNVGGAMLEAALEVMNTHGRIVACGAISQYNNKSASDAYPIRNLPHVIFKCITLRGFIVSQWREEFPAAVGTLVEHVQKGELKVRETSVDGFHKMPDAMIGLLTGANTGKMVVHA